MNTFKSMLVAGICLGSLWTTAQAADNQAATASGPAASANWLAPAANLHESRAKQAKEDFQLKKKRLENERDAALTRCAKETGQAGIDCRKQAQANFNSEVKRERLVYEEVLHQGTSSGSSSGGSHAAGGAAHPAASDGTAGGTSSSSSHTK